MTDDEVGTLWERISRQVAMEKRVKRKKQLLFLRVAGIAACISVLALSSYFVFHLFHFMKKVLVTVWPVFPSRIAAMTYS